MPPPPPPPRFSALSDDLDFFSDSSSLSLLKKYPKFYCFQRQTPHCWLCVFVIFVIVGVIVALSLTVGARTVTQHVIDKYFPEEFQGHLLEFSTLEVGPVDGDSVALLVEAPMPVSLPVSSLVSPDMITNVYYLDGATRRHVGVARLNGRDALLLPARKGDPMRLETLFQILDLVAFADMADHFLSINGSEKARNNATLFVDVWIPYISVLWFGLRFLNIYDLRVRKTIIMRDFSSSLDDLDSVNSVDGFFSLISHVLAGSKQVLRHSTDYMTISNFNIYDKGHAPPSIFKASSLDNLELPHDNSTMPFTLNLSFYNPTNIQLTSLGSVSAQLNYSSTCIVNVTLLDFHLDRHATTTVELFGYLRKEHGREYVLETIVPSLILKAMTTRDNLSLPFTLAGSKFYNEHEIPFHFRGQPLQLAIQSVLSRRVVDIGNHYKELGPAKHGLEYLFANTPVLGKLKMSDILIGLKLHETLAIIAGKVPIHVELSNPFACSIAIRRMKMDLYVPSNVTKVPFGTVEMFSDRPIVLEPFHLAPYWKQVAQIYSESGDPSSLTPFYANFTSRGSTPQFQFSYNMAQILSPLRGFKALRKQMQQQDFRVSARLHHMDLEIGNLKLSVQNITPDALHDIPLVTHSLASKVGIFNLFKIMMGPEGWHLTQNETFAYALDS